MRVYTVGLYTLGCKVSQYETEAITEKFEAHGFTVLSFEEKCDVYVINTCTVTAESDRKCRQIIRRAIKKNPSAVIAVVGCYSQRSPEEILAIDGVDIVTGTDDKLGVVERAEQVLNAIEKGESRPRISEVTDVMTVGFEPMKISRAPRARAYVKIEDGCESKCTYCAISAARGRVRSKPKDEVIEEVSALAASGVREIVLTGIETASYGSDFKNGYRLADLIREIEEKVQDVRIRLGSLAPELIGADFVKKVSGVKILAPHFHLSVQSGSDAVLRLMKRRYTAERAIENIERLREAFPTACFTTDLMVGFPGESEDDFLLTADFVRRVGFLDAHVFAYSRRKNTPAADYPNQIDEATKRERSERLIKIKNEVRDSVLDGIIKRGEPLSAVAETALADGSYTAHSDTYVEINFKPKNDCRSLCGEVVWVMPVSHKDGIVFGKLI